MSSRGILYGAWGDRESEKVKPLFHVRLCTYYIILILPKFHCGLGHSLLEEHMKPELWRLRVKLGNPELGIETNNTPCCFSHL